MQMIELEVKIPDSPGALIKLIKPISENSGNIHGIIHSHEDKSNEMIPVMVSFEIIAEDKMTHLENIKNLLLEQNFQIISITNIPAAHQRAVILSGHVFRQNFEQTVIRINSTGAKVQDLEAKFNKPEEISNVKFLIEIPDEIEDETVIAELRTICEEKDLYLLVEEVF